MEINTQLVAHLAPGFDRIWSIEQIVDGMSKKRKDSFMKGWQYIQRTGRVESHFDVFNKTREFELADGRPRLIWSPHPSLKASLG